MSLRQTSEMTQAPELDHNEKQLRLRALFAYRFIIGNLCAALLLAFVLTPPILGISLSYVVLLWGLFDSRNDAITKTMLDADPKGAKRLVPVAYVFIAIYIAVGSMLPVPSRKSLTLVALLLFPIFGIFSPAFRGTLDSVGRELVCLNLPKRKPWF
jgi:hypothetical protein